MKKASSLAVLGFWLLLLDSGLGASVNSGYQPSSTTASPSTTTASSIESSTSEGTTPSPANPAYPGVPVWSPTLGTFIVGRNAPPKYDRNNGSVPTPPGPHFGPPMPCPPCPCMQRPYMPPPMARYPAPPMYMPPYQDDYDEAGHRARRSLCDPEEEDCEPEDDEDFHTLGDSNVAQRNRRATNDDYWYGTGPANPTLLKLNMGYASQMAIRDQISKYGPPLHMGTISGDDFNFPNDFHAFEQPSFEPQEVRDNIIYELVGPIEVSPVGSLVGPIPNAPDGFTTLVLNKGNFRLLSIQKEGIMQIMKTDTNVVFSVDCNRQRYGGCQNLRPIRNQWDFPKFFPVVNQVYMLTGLLDTTSTADSTATTTISVGSFKINAISSREKFSMANTVTNAVVFVNCRQQVLPRTCEALKKI